jgi:TM2 domain-containing membrane protein YozV
MATQVQATSPVATQSSSLPTLCLIAGWLVPGAGHFLLRKPVRGALLFVAIVTMFAVGIGLQGEIYAPNTGDLLSILGFVGQVGSGLLYALAKMFDWGATSVIAATGDWGTKFIVVAGLFNVISAIDAHSLATGRKPSL